MVKASLTLALAAALIGPAAASAATPTVDVDPVTGAAVLHDGRLANFVTAYQDSTPGPTRYVFNGTVAPGVGCAQLTLHAVSCDVAVGALGELRGGAGDDRLFATFLTGDALVGGGTGDDRVYAGGQHAEVHGGAGNDVVVAKANVGGPAATGNDGDDLVIAKENSGDLAGNDGADVLVQAAATPGTATGGPGADTLIGLRPRGTYVGGADADIVAFAPPASALGLAGATIDGAGGDDRLYGSAKPDTITGGLGADLVDASGDGQVDTVDCGGGVDTAYVDADDVVTRCETVVVGAAPADAQVADAITKAQDDAAADFDSLQPLPHAS